MKANEATKKDFERIARVAEAIRIYAEHEAAASDNPWAGEDWRRNRAALMQMVEAGEAIGIENWETEDGNLDDVMIICGRKPVI